MRRPGCSQPWARDLRSVGMSGLYSDGSGGGQVEASVLPAS
jgi:hypothetical protein